MILSAYVLLSISGICALCMVIASIMTRSIIQDHCKTNENLQGSWHGGTFFAQPLFWMDNDPSNPELNRLINRYNRYITFLWLSFIPLSVAIVMLNLVDS
jgi:hypothetical protein